jgi:tRNA threonylcarbamoyl adenosine modification protein YeaZ
MVDAVMATAGVTAAALDAVGVTVGPGSFTGLRAALALAHGIALGAGCPVVGVTVGEAIAEAFPQLGTRRLWTAIDSRRGRVFLDRGPNGSEDDIASFELANLPVPDGPVAIAGDAAILVAACLAASGVDVALTDLREALPRHVAVAAARRLARELSPREAQPMYIDPPEAKLPAGGLRPPPVA